MLTPLEREIEQLLLAMDPEPDLALASSASLPDIPNKKNKTNWVEKAGGLPKYIERIAKHLRSEKGMDTGRAIATAKNTVERWCAGGDDVKPDTKAKACKALAEWNRKKSKGKKNLSQDDPLVIYEGVVVRASDRALIQEQGDIMLAVLDVPAPDPEAFDYGRYQLHLAQARLDLAVTAFDPKKHPRDYKGKFREVLGGLKAGESAKLPDGTTVRRNKYEKDYIVTAPGEKESTKAFHDADAGKAADEALKRSSSAGKKGELPDALDDLTIDDVAKAWADADPYGDGDPEGFKDLLSDDAVKAAQAGDVDALAKALNEADDYTAYPGEPDEGGHTEVAKGILGKLEGKNVEITRGGTVDRDEKKAAKSEQPASRGNRAANRTVDDPDPPEEPDEDAEPEVPTKEEAEGATSEGVQYRLQKYLDEAAANGEDPDAPLDMEEAWEQLDGVTSVHPGLQEGAPGIKANLGEAILMENGDVVALVPDDDGNPKIDILPGGSADAQELLDELEYEDDDLDPDDPDAPENDDSPENAQVDGADRPAAEQLTEVFDANGGRIQIDSDLEDKDAVSFSLPGGDDEENDYHLQRGAPDDWVVTGVKEGQWVLTELPMDAYDDDTDNYDPELLEHYIIDSPAEVWEILHPKIAKAGPGYDKGSK
jgi:hypothetical protein